MAGSLSIGARLDRLPATRTHRAVTVLAGIGSFFDLFDIFLAGVLGTVLTQQFHLSRFSLPTVMGSAFVGMFFGAAVLGRLADRVGRRRAFLLNLGLYSAFTLLGAFSTSAATLVLWRFLAGIGIGAELPLVDTYLSEMLPRSLRGRYAAWAYTIGFVGVPAAGFLGRFLVPRQLWGVEGWRWMFVAGSMGAAIVWLLRGRLPESPRWLESAGRGVEAEAILSRMEAEASAAPVIDGTDADPSFGAPVPPVKRGFRLLFGAQYRRRACMLSVFHVFQTVGYYGFGTLVPLVLTAKGYSIVSSLTFTSLTFIGYPIGSALSLLVIERIDRRWLIVGSAALMSVLGTGMGYATSPAVIVALGFLYTAASNVFSNSFHVFQVEIFPTVMRATASGAAYGLSRLSSAAMPFVLLAVLARWGSGPMFVVIAAALWIVILDIALFAPSTTGRPLEEVSPG